MHGFVSACDPWVRPNEDVLVVNSKGELLAFGRSKSTAKEFECFKKGIACKVREDAPTRVIFKGPMCGDCLMERELIIESTALTKAYGTHVALDSLDVKIEKGSTGLLGPNGAGKSTFLKTKFSDLYNSHQVKGKF